MDNKKKYLCLKSFFFLFDLFSSSIFKKSIIFVINFILLFFLKLFITYSNLKSKQTFTLIKSIYKYLYRYVFSKIMNQNKKRRFLS